MALGTFATSISCMDGRIQIVLSEWIRQNYKVDYVDTITAPGVDKRVADQTNLGPLFEMARISSQKHGSRLIVVSGHYDCAGNPVSDEVHKAQIGSSVGVIESWREKLVMPDAGQPAANDIQVVGVWVDDAWAVQRIA